MTERAQTTVTRLLDELNDGNRDALDALLPLVYEELLVLAQRLRLRWDGDYTLGTTALVHEAYLRLVDQERIRATSRSHFFALASTAMRHILCNYARDRNALKRGGAFARVALDDARDLPAQDAQSSGVHMERLAALDSALQRLAKVDARRSRVVECRFFGGMTVEDTAAALGVSPRTVKRDWAAAQGWLQDEVSSMLGDESDASGKSRSANYLEVLAGEALPVVLEAVVQRSMDGVRPGQRVAQHEIRERIAGGGMGVVYKAYDARLNRLVALKFLTSSPAAESSARERLMNEARAASALDHPNICTIFDVGEHDGRMFLTLAYYEGETLKQRIARAPLPIPEVLALARQIAAGLCAAHQRGVIHRDIKPSNVIVTADGTAKILDFGIARIRDGDSSEARRAIGTLAYMSPEQTRGAAIDARTDLWSLGVLVYEMLTGERPFRGDVDEGIVHDIRHASTPLVTSLRPGVPEALAALVQHCLEKEPAKRCRSAEALLAELRAIETAAASTLAPVRRLAVLPLTHSGMDPEDACLADGATEDLIGRLSSLSGLRVTARTSTLSFGSTDGSIAGAARELGVETLLQGSVVRWQQEVQVTLRLVDVANEHTFWTTTQQVPQDELAGTLRTLAWQVAGELDVKVHMGERRNVAKHGTDDPHAYTSYIKGRYLWNKRDRESLQQARGCFEHALDLDPSFAQAWTGLADTFLVLGSSSALPPAEAYPRARAAAERALAIDDELAEAHASLATSLADHYWDWATAEKHYRRAIELNPSYATARLWYAGFLRDSGSYDEALAELQLAQELDPLSSPIRVAQGITMYLARRYEDAIATYRKLLEITPGFRYAHFLMALAYVQTARYEDAFQALHEVEGWAGATVDATALAGYVHALLGNEVAAHAALNALDEIARRQFVSGLNRAMIHIALGDHDRALELLRQDVASRAKQVRLFGVEPMFDRLRADPRFRMLLAEVGLAGARAAVANPAKNPVAPSVLAHQ